MGVCTSVPGRPQKVLYEEIRGAPEVKSEKLQKGHKILLLGAGESGKSTIAKQTKIIYANGLTLDDRLLYRRTVYKNLVESAQALLLAMGNARDVKPDNRAHVDCILRFNVYDLSPTSPLPEKVAIAIHQLWNDPATPGIMDASGNVCHIDNASYFFAEALRIGHSDYVPTDADVLRAQQKSTEVVEARFNMGALPIRLIDIGGGQKAQREKWVNCYESVNSIIFCVALSEYDQVLLEDPGQNRMAKSLMLFQTIVNSRMFALTSVMLFLNKIDVFTAKLSKAPLTICFPEYTGGSSVTMATKHILWKFMQVNRGRLTVFPVITQATETTNMRMAFSTVVAGVEDTIRVNALRKAGPL